MAEFDIDHRLASYGTLAPGRANHHQLDGLKGDWQSGTVRGQLFTTGWGADFGYPAITLSDDGAEIEVHLFESRDLPGHWPRLDAFEGSDYARVRVQVETATGKRDAWIYADAKRAI